MSIVVQKIVAATVHAQMGFVIASLAIMVSIVAILLALVLCFTTIMKKLNTAHIVVMMDIPTPTKTNNI